VAVGGYDHGFEPVRSYLFLEMHSYVFHGFGAGCSLSTSVFLRNSSLSVPGMLDCLYLAVLINLVVKVLFLPVAFKKYMPGGCSEMSIIRSFCVGKQYFC